MRIDSIYLRDVGPFDEVRIDLPPGSKDDLADVYLLTGPNGCGKSTVLYAIAAAFAGHNELLGASRVRSRMRSEHAIVAIQMGDEVRALSMEESPVNPFDGTRLGITVGIKDGLRTFHVPGTSRRFDHNTYGMMFAYAGSRTTHDAHVVAIQEMTDNPLQNSLAFEEATDSQKLVHWIANQEFKRLKAKNANDADEADALYQSIRHIERIVADITEDPSFEFVHGRRDNDVRTRYCGRELSLGVLPAGLQSIVSWVADLLMRLDRSRWIDKTPPMERPFVLLLDEIDIHLHPAWQRKVLHVVQRLFPNAQIIASTHSPFVVASAKDARVITFAMSDGVSKLDSLEESQIGHSYRAVLQDIFGVKSEFDIDTEKLFHEFYTARAHLFENGTVDRTEVDRLAHELAQRGEEVADIIGLELRQLERQLAKRAAG